MNIYVVFYSQNGHVYKLAEAVAEGARSVEGASVNLFRTAELTRRSPQENEEADDAGKSFSHIPVISAKELAGADAVVFGTPSKFGMMAAEMRNLVDQTRPLWMDGSLIGKIGSVFTSTSTHQGGQESTITSFHVSLLHLGMIIVGVPYCANRLLSTDAISGRNPYGAATIIGTNGIYPLNETEIAIARFQGQHVAEVCRYLVRGRERAGGG